MRVIVIRRNPFTIVTYDSVSTISYANGIYTVSDVQYDEKDYIVRII